MKSGNLNFLEPSGPFNGTALPLNSVFTIVVSVVVVAAAAAVVCAHKA